MFAGNAADGGWLRLRAVGTRNMHSAWVTSTEEAMGNLLRCMRILAVAGNHPTSASIFEAGKCFYDLLRIRDNKDREPLPPEHHPGIPFLIRSVIGSLTYWHAGHCSHPSHHLRTDISTNEYFSGLGEEIIAEI